MGIGTHSFNLLDFPSNLDIEREAARITRSGVSFSDIMTAMQNAMAATTQDLHPSVGALTTQTTAIETDDESEDGFQITYGGEFAVALPQVSEDINHALPLRKLDQAVQFTEDFLEDEEPVRIARRLNRITRGYKNGFEAMVLEALFNPVGVPISKGSSTVSPKFIGYTGSDPAYGKITLADGTVIASPYTHYLNDTPANLLAAIKLGVKRLKAPGVAGPFDIIGSSGAVSAITALTEFVAKADNYVQAGSGTEIAVGLQDHHIGALKGMNVRVWDANDRIQDNGSEFWFAIVKTNGSFAENNPVGWRFDPRHGVTPKLRTRSMYPFDYATTIVRAGFSAYNRFGAVLVNIESTANGYTTPTIRG